MSAAQTLLDAAIIAGICLSYTPQIVRMGSSYGLHPLSVLLSLLSLACTLANNLIMRLPFLLECLSMVRIWIKFIAELNLDMRRGTFPLFPSSDAVCDGTYIVNGKADLICRAIVYCCYFPIEKKTVPTLIDLGTFYPMTINAHSTSINLHTGDHCISTSPYRSLSEQGHLGGLNSCRQSADRKISAEWRQVKRYIKISGLTLAFLALSIGGLLSILGERHFVVRLYGASLGVIAMMLAIWQYIPQILVVWHNSAIGSLSISTMLIQVPGSILLLTCQVLDKHSHFSSWLGYLCSSILQLVLLLICIQSKRYELRSMVACHRPFSDDENGAAERPVLVKSLRDELFPLLSPTLA